MNILKRVLGIKDSSSGSPNPTPSPAVERNWDNLPSVATTPVREPFSFRELTAYILKQTNKDLISVVPYGWNTSFPEEFTDTERFWEFADDPSLAAIFRDSANKQKVQLIIRASFMRRAATHVEATTWRELFDSISAFAGECKLKIKRL